MAHKVLQPICVSHENAEENSELVLPSFTFAPFAGRSYMDDVPTDLVLMTKFYRHDIHAALHVNDPDVASLLRTTIRKEFTGKRGEVRLIRSPLLDSQGRNGRHILLYGLGDDRSYSSRLSCNVFEVFFQNALELRAAHVTVPFIPNPMTKGQMTHRATAFKMKHVLRQVLAKWDGPVALKEVMAYCSPAAVRHIEQGLNIEQGDGCPCEGKRAR